MIEWEIVFQPKMDDAAKLDEFLALKLDPAYKHRLGHGGRVIIDYGLRDKDECYRVAEFVRHRNPIGEGLRYMVSGREGTTYIFLSYCSLCRQNKGPHFEHQK